MKPLIALGLFVCVLATAPARGPEGRLDLIITPNEGRPALVKSGASFQVLASEPAALSVVANGRTSPLEAHWSESHLGQWLANCQIPKGLPQGPYALRAETSQQSRELPQAVFVYESFPESYTVAHVPGPAISAQNATENHMNFAQTLAAVAQAGADLVLVTGNLTNDGTPAAFQAFLAALGACPAPVFVTPGPADAALGEFDAFFGGGHYAFWFGEDGYLAMDTKDYRPADDASRAPAVLHRLRRELKPARWSVGFTARYTPTIGLRGQLALFVDDPLDFLLAGAIDGPEGGLLPWGQTAYLTTRPAQSGAYRLIRVDGLEPAPGPVQFAENEPPAESTP